MIRDVKTHFMTDANTYFMCRGQGKEVGSLIPKVINMHLRYRRLLYTLVLNLNASNFYAYTVVYLLCMGIESLLQVFKKEDSR